MRRRVHDERPGHRRGAHGQRADVARHRRADGGAARGAGDERQAGRRARPWPSRRRPATGRCCAIVSVYVLVGVGRDRGRTGLDDGHVGARGDRQRRGDVGVVRRVRIRRGRGGRRRVDNGRAGEVGGRRWP